MSEEVKVSQLPETETINDDDIFMIVQNNINKKIKKSQVSDIKVVSNVSELINSGYRKGGIVKTLGYYVPQDGGGAMYLIVDDDTLTIDGSFIIGLENGLKAKMIIENNTVNILSLGARKISTNNIKYDIKPFILSYLEELDNYLDLIKLYIPSGLYACSPVELQRAKGFYIYGDSGFTNTFKTKTTITSMESQDYIIKIGNFSGSTTGWVFTNIRFSSGNYEYNNLYKGFMPVSYNEIFQKALIIENSSFGKCDLLEFQGIDGPAISISSSWELYFETMNFENINAFENGCLIFETVNTSAVPEANLSDMHFGWLRFERFTGNPIQFNYNNLASGIDIECINVEHSQCVINNIPYTLIQGNPSINRYDSIINMIGSAQCTIHNIQANNMLYRYYTINNQNYSLGSVIRLMTNNINPGLIIDNFTLLNVSLPVKLIESLNDYSHVRSNIIIRNIINSTIYNLIADIKKLGDIQIGSPINKFSEAKSNSSNLKKCIDNLRRDSLQNQGLISYESSSLNEQKLILENNNTITSTGKYFLQFILSLDKFTILAKIPSGASVDVAIQSTDGTFTNIASSTLIGTGEFKIYEINITNSNYKGKLVNFGLVNNNETVICKFDSFMG